MPFYVFAWIASIAYGLTVIAGKLTSKYQLKNQWQFSFFYVAFGLILTVPLAWYYGAGVPNSWTYILLAGLVIAVSRRLYIASLEDLDVTVLSPLFNFRVVFSVLLGYFFLGEILGMIDYLLIALVFVAGFFATMDESLKLKSFFSKNVAVGLVFMLSLAVYGLFINKATVYNSFWTVSLWVALISTLVLFLYSYPKMKVDLIKTPLKKYSGVLTMAILGAVAILASNKAYEANLGISAVIISLPLSMIFAFILSFIEPSLLEKHTLKVYVIRFAAAGVMIWAALQLSK